MRIDYVGLSLTMAERVRYRYKLEGVDTQWQEAGARRQAFYTNLRPGVYQFQVMASNNDGVWNETGATVAFTIPPAFIQTVWFVALCGVAGSALLWLLIGIRTRQVANRMRARLEDRLAERERIARELHDTLLQSTQGLIVHFQVVANRIARDEQDRAFLESTLKRADEVLAEGRDRVLDLRGPADLLADLPAALFAAGNELAQAHTARFSTSIEGKLRELEQRAKDEAYRIGREALINAFRHAQASLIEVQVIFGDADLRLRIRDDGLGIAAQTLQTGAKSGHWGLKGMRERALRIGAELAIWSRPDAGTEIELKIPGHIAYRETTFRSRWRSLWLLDGTKW